MDKRMYLRMFLQAPVYFMSNGKTYNGSMVDVCNYGMFVRTEADVMLGENVDVMVYYNNPDYKLSVTFPCKVARRIDSGFGLRSPHIDAHFLTRLETLPAIKNQTGDQLMAHVVNYLTSLDDTAL